MKRIFIALICITSCLNVYGKVIKVRNASALPNEPIQLYLDLMKRVLVNSIYEDQGTAVNLKLQEYDPKTREIGRDWPTVAHTMIGMKRLENIQFCLEDIIANRVPGDCIETGVWRGGATIFMRAILKAYGDTTRKVWVADSFEGLPPPDPENYPADKGVNLNKFDILSVSVTDVKRNFSKYGLLDNQVIFLKGFFRDTLPDAPIERLSLLRLDGDLYESTIQALEYLYPKLSKGGYVIVDDYYTNPWCAKAVSDYREDNGITESMINIDKDALYWKKQ